MKASRVFLIVFLIMLSLCLVNTQPVKANPQTIIVPDDYTSIQEAIDNADEGDTIFVKRRTYYDLTLKIDKSLSLIGEDPKTTILRGVQPSPPEIGLPKPYTVITFDADNVTISGFTITNAHTGISGSGDGTKIIGNIINGIYANAISLGGSYNTISQNNITEHPIQGIRFSGSFTTITGNNIKGRGEHGIDVTGSFNIISENNIVDTHVIIDIDGNSNTISQNNGTDGNEGIEIKSGSYNTVFGNNMTGNYFFGISITTGFNNTVYDNYLAHNGHGVHIGAGEVTAENNTFYHNIFVNNTNQVLITQSRTCVNYWDNGFEGNYWSDYAGVDEDGDGIGDKPYIIDANNQDRYPLMNPVVIPEFPDDEKPTTPTTEPFPTWVVTATVIVAVVGAALLVYFAKVKKTTVKVEKIMPEEVT